jgi:general secretion pathway protein K
MWGGPPGPRGAPWPRLFDGNPKRPARGPAGDPGVRPTTGNRRGSALLAVLWLSAVLAAIAFSLASTVHGEAERASTGVESTRAYYLATGAIQRAILYTIWGPQQLGPDGKPKLAANAPFLNLSFPTGETVVEIVPEASKFNINTTPLEDLFRLLVNLGVNPDRARVISMAIADWRSPSPQGSPFDQHYLSLTPSFTARHASFQEIEELLLVQGMTPDIYYGSYDTIPQNQGPARLVPRAGLSDCVSVFGATSGFDVNTAAPPVLATLGLPPDLIAQLVERRRVNPIRQEELGRIIQLAGPLATRLKIGGNTIFTYRATARPRLPNGQLSDLKRSVAAMVKIMPAGYDAPYHILRWYENAWSH